MKKLFFILSVFALVSCGGSSSETSVVDSTVVDSVVVDSTVVADTSLTVVDTVSSGGNQNGSIIKERYW